MPSRGATTFSKTTLYMPTLTINNFLNFLKLLEHIKWSETIQILQKNIVYLMTNGFNGLTSVKTLVQFQGFMMRSDNVLEFIWSLLTSFVTSVWVYTSTSYNTFLSWLLHRLFWILKFTSVYIKRSENFLILPKNSKLNCIQLLWIK